jgi:lipid-A-disaccharide synthase-like uncharacterized protein
MDDFRSFLYYPLGLLPSIFFALRFFIQWIQSEKSKKSYVTDIFWKLSLAGNILAGMHYLIQLQYIYLVIQVGNAFISWRNLSLIHQTDTKISKKLIGFIISLFMISLSVAYLYQTKFGAAVFSSKIEISLFWNFLGALGGTLFAARFWVQWWNAELRKSSQLNESFWILSILGGAISIAYSIKINDIISIINFSCGMIPYTRNLILLLSKNSQKIL